MKNSNTPSVPRTPREINFLQMATFFGGWIRVFICAPYDGENTRSREKIWGYYWFAREHSCTPVAPYLYYPQFFYEFDERDRRQMKSLARYDVEICSEIWVFGDVITRDMEDQLRAARKHGLKVRWFPDYEDMIRLTADNKKRGETINE